MKAVVEQESGGDTNALRLENGFYKRYVKKLGLPPMESLGRSVSWGLMQVMGQVARELGYEGGLDDLCNPEVGIELGCRYLANKLRAANGDLRKGLLMWNGGGNPRYPDEVIARMKRNSGQ